MKEKFIEGIYNYCDRWCERCSFTLRCRNFEGTDNLTGKQRDIDNEAFWKTISSNFEKAIELLYKIAAERGIDLDAISEEQAKEYEQRRLVIKITAKEHLLSKLCKQYQQAVMPFFKKQIDKELVDKTRELVSHLHMGMKSEEDVVYTMAGLGDCEEVIRWYLFFIDAKLQRALHGKIEDGNGEEGSRFQKDSDGSAKVAIIAIERSLGAWIRLYELMPSSEDVALQALSLLSQLKQKATEEFPMAVHFKRPGFDN